MLFNVLVGVAAFFGGWTQPDPTNPENQLPFDPAAAAQWVWDRKIALDAAG